MAQSKTFKELLENNPRAIRTFETGSTRNSNTDKLTAEERKGIPAYSGFIKYFPRAILSVARLSQVANEQHNPGEPLHWAKEKSTDEPDAMIRHLIDDALGQEIDSDGQMHLTKVAWRAMANLERRLEQKESK